MMKELFSALLLFFLLVFIGCNDVSDDVQKIVDNTIKISGGENYFNSSIEFDFRDRHYIAKRSGGKFSYERIFQDSANTVHDFVSNNGFRREVNGQEVNVPDSMAVKYTSSTNSVIYFALLPYGLNDQAVIKKLLGETTIDDQTYYEIQVTFLEEGGGEDHEDVFLYWIHRDHYTIDYMAYSFEESDEVSFRFRKAYNPRVVNGIRFQDYINYKPTDNSLTLDQAEELYKNSKLVELSRIESIDVKVDLIQ